MKNKLLLTCVAAILGAFGAQAAPKFQNVHLIAGNEAIGGKVTAIKTSQRWTADTVYIIDRLTFVEAPAVLTIEPGTIVRMEQKTTGGTSVTDPADVGTLIICRGAKIVANGTAESPIIFTNIDDPFVAGGEITIPNQHNGVTNNSTYAPYSSGGTNYAKNDYSGSLRFKYDATCGGLIILGRTPVAFGNPGFAGISVALTDKGDGYTGVPKIELSGGGSTNASFSAILEPTSLQLTNALTLTNRGVFPNSNSPGFTIAKDAGKAATGVATLRLINSGSGPDNQPGNADDNQYEIDTLSVTNGGDNYTVVPSSFITFTNTNNTPLINPGVDTPKFVGTKIAQIVVRNPGTGYTSAPTVSITGGGGSNAAAVATYNSGGFRNPTSVPLSSGIGANFIEGFQTIDGALLGTNNTVGTNSYSLSGSIYGGSDDDDNSGTLRFASIRYGGFVLSPNNEINGLTCGAVGRGTSFEFIEVVNNADDGIEHFAGSVDMKYVADLFGGDDGIDLDQGYRGRIQFAFQIQNNTSGTSRNTSNIGDCLGEWDGPESPVTGRPYTVHTLFNFTGIGTGNAASAGKGINYKDNSGGKVFNSIFADARTGLVFESGSSNAVSSEGSTSGHRFAGTRANGGNENFDIAAAAIEPDGMVKYTTFLNIGTNTNTSLNTAIFSGVKGSTATAPFGVALISSNNNTYSNVTTGDIRSIARVATNGTLDPRLTAGSSIRSNGIAAANSGGVRATDSFYTQTTLRGAFRDCNWLSGWSLLSEWGLLSDANCLIPAVRLTRSSTALLVGFNTEAGVEYAIETSNDGKKYTPFKTVLGTGTAANESLGAGTANALKFVRVMPL